MSTLALLGGVPVRKSVRKGWPRAEPDDIEAVTSVLKNDSWCRISGKHAKRFEEAFARFQNARYGVAVNSGTSALELGLLALGIQPGDEVIMSPYTFMAGPSSVLVTRGVPVFVDINPDTYNIDPEAIESAITEKTFAIMPVHFGGRSCEMDRIVEIARRHDLRIIEDASHAHGSSWQNHGLGTIGDVGAFSLGSGKNLSAGEGGILLTDNESIYQRAAELHDLWTGGLVQRSGDWGGGSFYSDSGWTFPQAAPNYRLSEILAALLNSQLPRLEEQTQKRFEHGRYLDGILAETDGVQRLRNDSRITRNAYHIFIFKYGEDAFDGLPRDLFVKALSAEGIPSSKGYPRGCHHHPLFLDPEGHSVFPYNRPLTGQQIDYSETSCPNTEHLCQNETVWLPTDFMLDAGAEGMDQTIDAIEKIRIHATDLLSL